MIAQLLFLICLNFPDDAYKDSYIGPIFKLSKEDQEAFMNLQIEKFEPMTTISQQNQTNNEVHSSISTVAIPVSDLETQTPEIVSTPQAQRVQFNVPPQEIIADAPTFREDAVVSPVNDAPSLLGVTPEVERRIQQLQKEKEELELKLYNVSMMKSGGIPLSLSSTAGSATPLKLSLTKTPTKGSSLGLTMQTPMRSATTPYRYLSSPSSSSSSIASSDVSSEGGGGAALTRAQGRIEVLTQLLAQTEGKLRVTEAELKATAEALESEGADGRGGACESQCGEGASGKRE